MEIMSLVYFLISLKAFDTVNHDILFTKLECHGIRDTPLQWFKSYLSEREQYVIYNETCCVIILDNILRSSTGLHTRTPFVPDIHLRPC